MLPEMIPDIDTALSTERLALCWVATSDATGVPPEQWIQRYLLALVYYYYDDDERVTTAGAETEFMNWLSNDSNECDWDFIECNKDDKVEKLLLTNIGLQGKIPASYISHFTNLIHLDVSHNKLTGSIPDKLWRMPHLEYLHTLNNNLSGFLSNEISNLSQLRSLMASTNSLTGTIPDLSSLTNLEKLIIGSNAMEGSFPDVSSSTNLGKYRSRCSLSW